MQQPQQSSAPGGAPALTVPMLQAPVQATLQGPAFQASAQVPELFQQMPTTYKY